VAAYSVFLVVLFVHLNADKFETCHLVLNSVLLALAVEKIKLWLP
jgi:hypothetical protein